MRADYDKSLSHFDLDMKRGKQGELFVSDIRDAFASGTSRIEVKTDFRFFESMRFYIETECRGRDGVWRPSGLNVTRAQLWAIVLGNLPGMMIFDTDWLRRAVAVSAGMSGSNILSCDYGENPTKGVVVTLHHLRMARDA